MNEQVKDNQMIIDLDNSESVKELADFIDVVMQKVEQKRKEQQRINTEKNIAYRKQFTKKCLEKYAEWKAISTINSDVFENDRQCLSAINKTGNANDISRVIAKIDCDPVLRNSIVAQLEKLLETYQAECVYIGRNSSERKYNVLKAYYFTIPRLKMPDIVKLYQTEFGKISGNAGTVMVDKHAVYRDLRNATDDFTNLFWGVYNLFIN